MLRIITISCLLCLLFACNNDGAPQLPGKIQQSTPVITKRILVTGITGGQGGAVAHALLDKGYQVRGLSRNPSSERALAMSALGVDMFKGDFEDTVTLDKAMQDIYGVFLVTNYWEHGYESEIQQGKN